MPEQSEWLLAVGERSVTLGIITPALMRRTRISASSATAFASFAFHVVAGIPGVALKLNTRLRALGLSPSAYNLFRFERIVLCVVVFGEIIDIFALLLLALGRGDCNNINLKKCGVIWTNFMVKWWW